MYFKIRTQERHVYIAQMELQQSFYEKVHKRLDSSRFRCYMITYFKICQSQMNYNHTEQFHYLGLTFRSWLRVMESLIERKITKRYGIKAKFLD